MAPAVAAPPAVAGSGGGALADGGQATGPSTSTLIERAAPAPGVLEAIARADLVVLCPSNPVVSIGTILAVPGIREALRAVTVVGVSPIVAGRVVRGMADRLLPAAGVDISATGVATLYRDVLDGWVIDDADADAAPDVQALGPRVVVTDTMMHTIDVATAVARTAVDLGLRLRAGS